MSTAFYPLGMMHTGRPKKGYVSWKGSDEYANPTSISAGNIRPLTNNDPTNDAVYKHGLPRPIKHYRRGTIATPDRQTKGVHPSITQTMETPGGFVQNRGLVNDTNCGGNEFISEWSPIQNLTQKPDLSRISCATDGRIIGGEANKALRRVRTASTIIKKNYYQTSAEHLYNRCKTFDQVESHYSQSALNCETDCPSVYKPSNQKFAMQGAVSSSTRLIDLQRSSIGKGNNYMEKQTPCIQYRRKR